MNYNKFYNIEFVNSERSLAKNRVMSTQVEIRKTPNCVKTVVVFLHNFSFSNFHSYIRAGQYVMIKKLNLYLYVVRKRRKSLRSGGKQDEEVRGYQG